MNAKKAMPYIKKHHIASHKRRKKMVGTRVENQSMKATEVREGYGEHELLVITNQRCHFGLPILNPTSEI